MHNPQDPQDCPCKQNRNILFLHVWSKNPKSKEFLFLISRVCFWLGEIWYWWAMVPDLTLWSSQTRSQMSGVKAIGRFEVRHRSGRILLEIIWKIAWLEAGLQVGCKHLLEVSGPELISWCQMESVCLSYGNRRRIKTHMLTQVGQIRGEILSYLRRNVGLGSRLRLCGCGLIVVRPPNVSSW